MGMFGSGRRKPAPNVFARADEYRPTVRDKTARALLNVFGDGYQQRQFIEDLLGSSGLGHSKTGLVDWTPVGAAFASDEGGRKAAKGNIFGGAGEVALAALPIPAAAKGVKGMFGAGKRVKSLPKPPTIDRSQAARMARAEALGFTEKAYHGTPTAFADDVRPGSGTNTGPHASDAIYAADEPAVANSYARGDQPAVYPLMIRPDDFATMSADEFNFLLGRPPSQAAGAPGMRVPGVRDYSPLPIQGPTPAATTYGVFDPSRARSFFDDFADPPPRTTAKRHPDGSSRKRR